jgi:hypothetical protein
VQDAARHFLSLLDRERDAACQADVEALVAIQDEKTEVLARLRTEGTPNDMLEHLTAAAEANIVLMRHLVLCLRGLIEGVDEASTYNASGSHTAQVGSYGLGGA